MMTQSHFLLSVTAAVGLRRRALPLNMAGVVVGSVAPDLPLFVLTFWFWLVPMRGAPETHDELFGTLYDQYFFGDATWIVAHNLFHAPIVLAALGVAGWMAARRHRVLGSFLVWFAASAMVHAGIDALTHVNDGPLLLFPVDWSFRFRAPISYWDPDHGGLAFSRIEWTLDLILAGYLGWLFIRWRRQGNLR